MTRSTTLGGGEIAPTLGNTGVPSSSSVSLGCTGTTSYPAARIRSKITRPNFPWSLPTPTIAQRRCCTNSATDMGTSKLAPARRGRGCA